MTGQDEQEMINAHQHGVATARRHWPMLSGDPETMSRHVYGSWSNSEHERFAFLAGYVQEGKRMAERQGRKYLITLQNR